MRIALALVAALLASCAATTPKPTPSSSVAGETFRFDWEHAEGCGR
jgi:hypothetical protein